MVPCSLTRNQHSFSCVSLPEGKMYDRVLYKITPPSPCTVHDMGGMNHSGAYGEF
jgi:hypothetical protein